MWCEVGVKSSVKTDGSQDKPWSWSYIGKNATWHVLCSIKVKPIAHAGHEVERRLTNTFGSLRWQEKEKKT